MWKRISKRKETWWIVVAIVLCISSLGLYQLASRNTAFADWHVHHVYPILLNIFGRISNLIPISLVELLLYIVILYSIVLVIRGIYNVTKKKVSVGLQSYKILSTIMLLLGIIVSLYIVNCGMNYYRTDFVTISDLKVDEYTSEDIKELCEFFVEQINEYQELVNRDENGEVVITKLDYKKAKQAMSKLGQTYKELDGYYPNPKPIVVSEILSYQHLSGVYSPFTMEANVNEDMSGYYLPFTMCHELSHLKGFMKEEEANFIAYLACVNSEDPLYQYSAYMMGYSYSMGELRYLDHDAYDQVRSKLSENASLDYAMDAEFWRRYEGKIAEISTVVNDTYLKVNAQPAGVRSYNQVVGLIVADWKEKQK